MAETTIQIEKIEQIKIGDVFETSWGYDQTNYDFIVVIEISPTGKTAVCQRAEYEIVGHTSQANIQKPIAKGYGKTFRLLVDNYRSEIGLRGSYIFCGDENSDSKRFGYFSKVKEGQTFAETDSQFGH